MDPVHDRGSMDPVHILMDPVHGPGPWRGSMDPWSMFCTFPLRPALYNCHCSVVHRSCPYYAAKHIIIHKEILTCTTSFSSRLEMLVT